MTTLSNPSEIARETLKQLAVKRLLPTPDNYRALYLQISGTTDTTPDAYPERQFKILAAKLPRHTPAQLKLAQQFEQAISEKHWAKTIALLAATPADSAADPKTLTESPDWTGLIARLMQQWEARQSGLTPYRKREGLDHILKSRLADDVLFEKLGALIDSWSQKPADTALVDPADHEQAAPLTGSGDASVPTHAAKNSSALDQVKELFAFTLDGAVASLLVDAPKEQESACRIADKVRRAVSAASLGSIAQEIKQLAFRIELIAEDQVELKAALLHLLQLVIDNIAYLAEDDRWLHGQVEIIRTIVDGPLNVRTIDDAERRMKDVIFKQTQLKTSLKEAREAMKAMLAGFVDHLAAFSESTSDYHDKIERCARKISEADHITDLESVIAEVMEETRVIRLNAQRSRDELHAMRERVRAAEAQIDQLQKELEATSSLVRQDQLTGALNRRGLEDVFEKEIARAQRRKSPLCAGVLDIDNFKKLNDSLGHDAGDAALVHLTQVIRDTLRPQDTLARYGGEEFVILLPDTDLEDGRKALVRLQRELTKRYFLHNNQKLLITFSAGVTEIPEGEAREQAIKRADELMYKAKTTGKNKVVSG